MSFRGWSDGWDGRARADGILLEGDDKLIIPRHNGISN